MIKRFVKYRLLRWRYIMRPGPRFNMKMTSYQYRKSHCGDKTILRTSYLHNGIFYIGKMMSLYWIEALNDIVCQMILQSSVCLQNKINLLGLAKSYMQQWHVIGSGSIAYRMFETKPLPTPLLSCVSIKNETWINISSNQHVSFGKILLNYAPGKWRPLG